MIRVASVGSQGHVERTSCLLCGRATFDPGRGEGVWAHGVAGGRQVLICPDCQRTRPRWDEQLDRCRTCGATRLSLVLGDLVCRACGAAAPAEGGGPPEQG